MQKTIVCALVLGLVLLSTECLLAGAPSPAGDFSSYKQLRENHLGVGSWFGKAMQVCTTGADPTKDCVGLGLPAVALFMTPTFLSDGTFLGNDSLALGAPPLGPHTTAHGEWVPTSKTDFVADIVLMLNAFPPTPEPAVSAVHIHYAAHLVDPFTMQGYVNFYLFPPIPIIWSHLASDEFPPLPDLVYAVAGSPTTVVTDPNTCKALGCPLVFKFHIKRVSP